MRDPSTTWAERILTFLPTGKTEPRRLFVWLGRPFTQPGMLNAWRVDAEIAEPNEESGRVESLKFHCTGEDSFQALQLALVRIGRELENWEARGNVTLDGGDHGFPRTPVDVG